MMSSDGHDDDWAALASRRAPTDEQWSAAKITYSPATPVHGVVLSHHPFGFFVDLGGPVVGLVESIFVTNRSDTDERSDGFPAVGADIQAVVLGAVDHNRQIRLSMRPSDAAPTG